MPKRPVKQLGIGDIKIGAQAIKFVNQVLSSNRLSYGPFSQKFEQEFAKLHQRKYAIFCNSGTSALQVALHALKSTYKWADGDEVLVPAVTFPATSNIVIQNNLKPVFVDIERDYFLINPEQIEKYITKKTRVLIPVHLFGQSADMVKILQIAKRHNLKILEDSAQAMFVKYNGKPVGSLGDIACFSTYATHLITTGVGGIAATNDDEIAVKMKSLFNHGRDGIYLKIDDDAGVTGAKLFEIVDKRFSFVDVGYSYRATELEAAIGLAQLRKWEQIIKKRQQNAAYLVKGLSDLQEYIQLPKIRPGVEHAFMLFPILVINPKNSRDKLVFFLEDNLIETRYLFPLLNQPIYKKLFGNLEENYPVAKFVTKNGLVIGCHPNLTKNDLDWIVFIFRKFFQKYD